MELTPLPELYKEPDKPFVPRNWKKKKKLLHPVINKWTKEERQLLIDNSWMNGKELRVLLPRHSIRSITRYIWGLRQIGKLEKPIKKLS